MELIRTDSKMHHILWCESVYFHHWFTCSMHSPPRTTT